MSGKTVYSVGGFDINGMGVYFVNILFLLNVNYLRYDGNILYGIVCENLKSLRFLIFDKGKGEVVNKQLVGRY